jgi:hypothetical protein
MTPLKVKYNIQHEIPKCGHRSLEYGLNSDVGGKWNVNVRYQNTFNNQ